MKKTLALLILSSSALFAQGADSTNQPMRSCCCPAPRCGPTCEITPSANPDFCGCIKPFFTADFIWWNIHQEGLIYAEDGRSFSPTLPPPSFSQGSVKDMDFNYQPGFKVGAGLVFRRDRWDLYANYTWLNPVNTTATAVEDVADGHLRSRWVIPFFQNANPFYVSLSSAEETWKFNFNALDLELGRNFFVSPRLAIRPHVGLKGGWMKQDVDLNYQVVPTEISANPLNPSEVLVDMDQSFWGVGIRAGLNSAYTFWNHWSIYGDLAVAELWSHFKETRTDVTTVTGTQFVSYDLDYNFHALRTVLELGIGLRFSYDFCQCTRRMDIEAGWEEQIWFDQNQFITPIQEHQGDLMLSGLTAKIGFFY